MDPHRQPDEAQSQVVRTLAEEACVEMFTSLGAPVTTLDEQARAPAGAHDIASFIGFTGPVRGCLMLSSSVALFESCYPNGTRRPVSSADVVDWAAELANQLLGRLKRRFCARGVDFEASTPTAVQGLAIAVPRVGRAGVCELWFRVGGHEMSVCLEVKSVADAQLFKEPASPIDCQGEGDLVVF